MRTAPADVELPAAVPFFYGYWPDTTVPAGAFTDLTINAVQVQKGMRLSDGGCKVPIAGLYHIGMMCRSDAGAFGATYTEVQILRNRGGSVGTTLQNNPYVNGSIYPYAAQQLWVPAYLNAGDTLNVQAYNNAMTMTFFGAGWAGSGLRVLYAGPPTGVQ